FTHLKLARWLGPRYMGGLRIMQLLRATAATSEPERPRQRVEATSILPSSNGKTARSWRGIVPFTHLAREGAYDSHYLTAGIAGCTRRRGGIVAARGARAAAGDAGDRVSQRRVAGIQ